MYACCGQLLRCGPYVSPTQMTVPPLSPVLEQIVDSKSPPELQWRHPLSTLSTSTNKLGALEQARPAVSAKPCLAKKCCAPSYRAL